MKDFYDTSVLVAAFFGDHPQHEASVLLVGKANKKDSACGIHSLAEVHAVMSVLPVKPTIPPEQVMLFIQEIRDHCTVVTLSEGDYFETIRHAAERGFISGRIYDALLLRCAIKANAERIYTWNLKHFHALAPELVARIRTP